MRVSRFLLSTLKEAPAEAELVSHRLMLRAGMIKRLAAGIYTWMPLGLRVMRKVEAIVREEMNRAGAIELLMPVVQPAELWQETGRWAKYGPELLRLKDRHERDFIVQPTSEEVITDIARKELKSYKQLPVNLYHIQTKFRDEVRPRFGVMRSREFVMKDAYSFDVDKAGMLRVVPGDVRRVCAHLHADGTQVPRGRGRHRRRSAAARRTSSRCSPIRARTPSPGARRPTTRPTSSSPRRSRLAPSRPAPAEPMQKVPTPRQGDLRGRRGAARAAAVAHGQMHHARGRIEGTAGARPHAADPRRSRAERDQGHQDSRAREIPLGDRGRNHRGDRLQARATSAPSASRRTCRSSSTARWP